MQQIINLYIGGKEVEFSETPDILFNYTVSDLYNPTIVKNSYTKTVKIDGTPTNNDVFGNIFQLDRAQLYSQDLYSSIYFNPSKRVPFVLYINGDIYESGYCQLDKIVKKNKSIEYQLTLYGGLGEFFYSLSYDDDGEKLKLSDLDYLSGGEDELNFKINKDTVASAWTSLDTIDTVSGNVWDVINFAPCYDGIPEKLNADKVLINYSGATDELKTGVTVDSKFYSTRNGYALAEAPDELTAWEVKDLRSYLQRPVIRIKKIVEAVDNFATKKGYNLNLDSEFFTTGNTYYNNTWVTLPLITELEYLSIAESDTAETPSITVTRNRVDDRITEFVVDMDSGYTDLSFTGLCMTYVNSTANRLYTSQRVKSEDWSIIKDYEGCILLQMVAFNGSQAIAASDGFILTSVKEDGTVYEPESPDTWGNRNRTYMAKTAHVCRGYFKKYNGNYVWADEDDKIQGFKFDLNTVGITYTKLALIMTWCANNAKGMEQTGSINYDGLYPQTIYVNSGGTSSNVILGAHSGEVSYLNIVNAVEIDDTASYTNKLITKKILLNTESSPCDFFLDYCKQFGLIFYKNSYDNTINVLTRKNFYKRTEIIDINDKICRNKDIKITPLTFEAAFYEFGLEPVESVFGGDYSATTSHNFDVHIVNTGYEFNKDTSSLLDGNSYKSAIECEEKSKYFAGDIKGSPMWLHKGVTYNLYETSPVGSTTASTELDVTVYNTNTSKYNSIKNYNWFACPQFHSEENKPTQGNGVILFYKGKKACKDFNDIDINMYLTDDVATMFLLNDSEPCYMLNYSEYDYAGSRVAIKQTSLPQFGRYIYSGDTIADSLDFGNPRQLYVLNKLTADNTTIFDRYWKSYISDLYDVDNRKIELYMILKERPTEEMLRKFYWFDNSIWRINKLVDYNLCSYEPTKVELIKVKNTSNYI